MTFPLVYEINIRLWLAELSRYYGHPIHLGNLPSKIFSEWQELGFTHVWLMGVWPTGPESRSQALTSRSLKNRFGELSPDWTDADVPGSPFAIAEYRVCNSLGGIERLQQFRKILHSHGLKLLLDFIPNHLGLDHPWIATRPEVFVQSPKEVSGTFRARTARGSRWMAHGKDPNFPPWRDTVQLDYRNAATRAAMIETLRSLAEWCDGVRCDMAMLLLNDVFAETWRELPSPHEEPQSEFWPAAIRAVKKARPNFLFLAEVYWNLEAKLHALGFDFTYDKQLYDYIVYHDFEAPTQYLLGLTPEFIQASAHFLENHDEPRIASILPLAKHLPAALLILGLPGMRLLHQGQLSGAAIQLPVHLTRAPVETSQPELSAFYRKLLTTLSYTSVGRGKGRLLRPQPAWIDNPSAKNFALVQWQTKPPEFDLVAVNLAPYRSQCRAELPVEKIADYNWQMDDLLGLETYQRRGTELANQGLFLDLPPHGAQLFHFRPIA